MKQAKQTFIGLLALIAAMILLVMFAFSVSASLKASVQEPVDFGSYDEVLSFDLDKQGKPVFSAYNVRVIDNDVDFQSAKMHVIAVTRESIYPGAITVNKGENVKFIVSSDAKCDFEIPEYGISTYMVNGDLTEITFNAERTGVYTYSCNTCCGIVDRSGTLNVI